MSRWYVLLLSMFLCGCATSGLRCSHFSAINAQSPSSAAQAPK